MLRSFLALLLLTTPAYADETFSPDRPSRSDSATMLDAGHFAYETELASHTGGAWISGDTVLKYGVAPNMELDLGMPPLLGQGDFTGRIKLGIMSGEISLAAIPWATDGNGGLSVPMSHQITDMLSVNGEAFFSALDGSAGSVSLSMAFGTVTASLELWDGAGGATVDPSLAWMVTPDIQIDTGANIGATNTIYFGISERF